MNRDEVARQRFWGMVFATAIVIIATVSESRAQESVARWSDQVGVYYNPTAAPVSEREAVSAIEYALWSWGERTGLRMDYKGLRYAEADKQSGFIVIQFVDSDWLASRFDLRHVPGVTQMFWRGGQMLASNVYINSDQFATFERCDMYILMHELGHAIGIMEHSDDPNDVMYPGMTFLCNHVLTYNDVEAAGYGMNVCHAELTREMDAFIPSMNGHQVMLRYSPDQDDWRVFRIAESDGHCSDAGLLDNYDAVIGDIRSPHGAWSVHLDFLSTDRWALGGSEPITAQPPEAAHQ